MKFICWRSPQFTHYSHHSPSVCANVSWLYYLQGNPLFFSSLWDRRGNRATFVKSIRWHRPGPASLLFLFVIVLLWFILFIALLVQGACTHSLLCILLTTLFFLGFLLEISSLVTMMPLRWLAGWLYMILTTLMILHGMCSPVLHFPCLLCMWQLVLRTLGAWWCGKHVAFRI